MNKIATLVLCVCALAMLAGPVHATVLTFEDLRSYCAQGYAYYNQMPSVYSGLKWSNFYAVDGPRNASYYYMPAGWGTKALESGSVGVFDGSGNPASITPSTKRLTLHSGYFTATWYDGLSVEADGYLGGILKYSKTFTLSAFGPTLVTFEFSNVDKVVWSPSGGTPVPDWVKYGGGTNFEMDDLSYDIVPEPSCILALLCGVGGLGGLMLRKRR